MLGALFVFNVMMLSADARVSDEELSTVRAAGWYCAGPYTRTCNACVARTCTIDTTGACVEFTAATDGTTLTALATDPVGCRFSYFVTGTCTSGACGFIWTSGACGPKNALGNCINPACAATTGKGIEC